MKLKESLALLKFIKAEILDTEDKFTTRRHFRDKDGHSLPPDASSLPQVARRCVGGAVIEGLVRLNINKNASSSSKEYWDAMYCIGDVLGPFDSGTQKQRAVQKLNNELGFTEVHIVLDKAIAQLEK